MRTIAALDLLYACTGGFADTFGVEPVVTIAFRGYSDEALHIWHPAEYGKADAMPWGSITDVDGQLTFVQS